MRLARPLLLALALLLIAGAASAEARRKATHAERAAIAAKFDAPPKCARVFVSTVDRHWATYRFDGRTFDDPDCRAAAADGVAILRRRHGHWRMVTAGSSFECPVPKTPPKVAADLRVRCVDQR